MQPPTKKLSVEEVKKDKPFSPHKPAKVHRSHISWVGSNEVLGLEEAYVGSDLKMCTIKCISNEGKALQIKKEDLFRVIKGDEAREKVREFV